MKNLFTCTSFLLLAMLVMASTYTQAQNGSISGVVMLNDSTSPLPYANVWLKGARKGTTSNAEGKFNLKNIPAGIQQMEISSVGYNSWISTVEVVSGKETSLTCYISEAVLDLPAVMVTANSMTGGAEGIKTLPGSAYYVSPKEMQRFSYSDADRAMRSVPGVHIQEEDGFGLRPNIGLRGTGVERSAKITLMEDGVLTAPAPYIAPAAYYFPTMGRMQAVEVMKGSSQIKYGPHTTGGAIDMISTQIPDRLNARFTLLGGTNAGRKIHASVGSTHGRFSYLVETYQYGSDGFKELDNGGNTGFSKQDYVGKVRYSTNPEAKMPQLVTLKIGAALENSNETYLGLTEADFDSTPYRRYAGSQKDNMETQQHQISLKHDIEFSNKLQLSTTIYRTEFHRNWYKLDKVIDSTGTATSTATILNDPTAYAEQMGYLTGNSSANNALSLKANNREYYAQGVQTALNMRFGGDKFKHDVSVGLRVHEDQIDRFQWKDGYKMENGAMFQTSAGVHGTESNRVETAFAVAGFAQYRIQKGRTALKPGLRYENISMNRKDYGKEDPDRSGVELSERDNMVDVWIPGLTIEHELNKQFFFFAGVHKGFTPPGTKEGTMPEESWNYELGTRWNKPGLSANAVVFFNDYQNLLGVDLAAAGGEGSTDLFNAGEAQTYGLELSIQYDLLAKSTSGFSLPIMVNYTHTTATFSNTFESAYEPWAEVQSGDEFPYLAPNQLAVQLALEHASFGLSLNGKYTSKMRTVAGQDDIPESYLIGSSMILDASAYYRLAPQVQLFASANNLLNEVYLVSRRPAGLRPGLPRTIMVGLKANI